MSLYAGIEAGGTKFVCAVASDFDTILKEERFPTTTPEETLPRALDFFRRAEEELKDQYGSITSMGIAAFGPVNVDSSSPRYGWITSTPKPGWKDTDIRGYFVREMNIPVGFDTDVNGAALGEGHAGAGQGLDTFMYITIGTGVGGGIIVNNMPVHGLVHPEVGHIILKPREGEEFEGVCPYHTHCVEGMCAGPAIKARWGTPGDQLPDDHEAWDVEASYIAQALMSYVLIISPERIILGGGVMHQRQLFPKIRKELKTLLNGYVDHPAILEEREDYIVPPGLEDHAGITGAFILAAGAEHR